MTRRRRKQTVTVELPPSEELQRFHSAAPRVLLFNIDVGARSGLLGDARTRGEVIVCALREYLEARGLPTDERMEVLLKY